MRKVKVLAFVLAALMVVAAFAGCGTKQLKTDVSTLDERVTALEELLKQVNSTVNNAATADQINELLEAITANKAEAAAGDKALADAIAKITADQTAANDKLKADLEKLVNDVKADQKTGDTALQVAIEKLNNSLAATNKALEDSIEDLLEKIEDGDEDLSDAIVETNKALADAIAAINKAQDAQGKDVADALAASNKALEDAIKALQESTKASDDAIREDLLDAIEAITAAQNKQGEDLAAALKETNDALAAAIESLKGEINTGDDAVRAELIAAIEALTKKQEEQNNAIADALAGLKETIEQNKENAGANASLQAAISKYVSDLTVAKTTYDFNQLHYTESDFAAVNKAITTGLAAVQAATTVDAAKAAYDAAVVELAKYERVDVALYNAYKALSNKVNADSKEDVFALDAACKAALAHYEDTKGDDGKIAAIEKYVYAAGKTVDLKKETANIVAAYRYITTFIADVEALVEDIDAIKRVQYKDLIKADVEDCIASNVSAVVAANTEYSRLKGVVTYTGTDKDSSATDMRKHGRYLDDNLQKLITNSSVITGHVATLNALTEAATVLTTYANTDNQGAYLNVFKEYVDINDAQVKWFNMESKFKTVNARLANWMADYPKMDAANAEAIIDAYLASNYRETETFNYATYLANEAEMKLFLAAYNTFKTDLVPRIKVVDVLVGKSTDNVAMYVELVKDIADWKIVIPDSEDDVDEDPELVVDDAQYTQMCKSAMSGRTTTFKFTDAEFKAFVEGDVAKAEKVAEVINKKIDQLEAKAATLVSVVDFKLLEGYELVKTTVDGTVYEMDSDTYVVADLFSGNNAKLDVTIAQYKSAFVVVGDTFSYDLTVFLDLDELAAAQKIVEANVVVCKEATDKIQNNLDALLAKLAATMEFDLKTIDPSTPAGYAKVLEILGTVSLDDEALVKVIKTDYTNLIAKGYKTSTMYWAPYSENGVVVKGQYLSSGLLDTNTVYEITGVVAAVDTLRSISNNLVNFVKLVKTANTYYAFDADNIYTRSALTAQSTYEKWYDADNKNKTHYQFKYMSTAKTKPTYDANGVITGFSWGSNGVESKDTSTSGSKPTVGGNAYTQFNAVETAWTAYYSFLVANGGYTDANLEKAMADNGMEALKLIAIKHLASNFVSNLKEADTAWSTDFGVYTTQRGLTATAIKNATSVEAIAEILHSFYELTEVEYTSKNASNAAGIWFAGKQIFHANGTLHYEVELPLVCPNCP